jgi:hypothetical protein
MRILGLCSEPLSRRLARTLLAGLLVVASAAARAEPCADSAEAPPAFSFNVNLGQIAVTANLSRDQLQSLQSRRGGTGIRAGWQPIGLTLADVQMHTQVQIQAVPAGRGRYCARLTAVEATMGVDRIDVFVANRYRPGSCQYESVLEHEMRHVAIFRDAVQRFAPAVRRRLEETARALPAVSAPSADEAAKRLQARLQRQVQPIFKEMNRAIDRANQLLDSPENYAREQTRCPSW